MNENSGPCFRFRPWGYDYDGSDLETLGPPEHVVNPCGNCSEPSENHVEVEPAASDNDARYLTAAREAAAARKRFSEQFLLYKVASDKYPKTGVTDGQATHQAYIDCGIDRDMAEARLELARLRLTR